MFFWFSLWLINKLFAGLSLSQSLGGQNSFCPQKDNQSDSKDTKVHCGCCSDYSWLFYYERRCGSQRSARDMPKQPASFVRWGEPPRQMFVLAAHSMLPVPQLESEIYFSPSYNRCCWTGKKHGTDAALFSKKPSTWSTTFHVGK